MILKKVLLFPFKAVKWIIAGMCLFIGFITLFAGVGILSIGEYLTNKNYKK